MFSTQSEIPTLYGVLRIIQGLIRSSTRSRTRTWQCPTRSHHALSKTPDESNCMNAAAGSQRTGHVQWELTDGNDQLAEYAEGVSSETSPSVVVPLRTECSVSNQTPPPGLTEVD